MHTVGIHQFTVWQIFSSEPPCIALSKKLGLEKKLRQQWASWGFLHPPSVCSRGYNLSYSGVGTPFLHSTIPIEIHLYQQLRLVCVNRKPHVLKKHLL